MYVIKINYYYIYLFNLANVKGRTNCGSVPEILLPKKATLYNLGLPRSEMYD